MELSGKVAFITGPAKGLGKGFAEALLEKGAKAFAKKRVDGGPKHQVSWCNTVEKVQRYRESIDEPFPSNVLWATKPEHITHLHVSADDKYTPVTIPSMLLSALQRHSSRMALVMVSSRLYDSWTYTRYYVEVLVASKAFIQWGFQTCESLAVDCTSSPIATVCMLAAIFAGGTVVSLKDLGSRSLMLHVLKDARASIVVIDSLKSCHELMDMEDELPDLKLIIQTVPNLYGPSRRLIQMWTSVLLDGETVSNEVLAVRLNTISPNRCCLMSYTEESAGQTLSPKAVLFSHDNFTFMARSMASAMDIGRDVARGMRFLSYLHPGSRNGFLMEVVLPLHFMGTVCFPGIDDRIEKIVPALILVRPHIFWGNHAIWFQIHQCLRIKARTNRSLLFYLMAHARHTILRSILSHVRGKPKWAKYLNRKVRETVGLNKCRFFFSFDNHLPPHSLEYLLSVGISVCQSLSCKYIVGPHSMNTIDKFNFLSVGQELPGCKSASSATDDEFLNELYISGRHVCVGIKEDSQSKRHSLSSSILHKSGLQSGCYYYVKDNFNFVTGIKKDLIFLLDGNVIEYRPIETTITSMLPFVNHCVVIGQTMAHLTALLTIKTERHPVTHVNTTKISQEARAWLLQAQCYAQDIHDVTDGKDFVIPMLVDEAIMRYNRWSKSWCNWIHDWIILPRNFSVHLGEIDPVSGELNRLRILQNFENKLEFLYT